MNGGNINVGIPGAAKSTEIKGTEFGLKTYPNPFDDHVYFDLQLTKDSKVRLEIFNIDGSKLATIYDDVVIGYDHYQFEYSPENVSAGKLVYHMIVDGQLMFTGKLIHY